MRLRIMILTVLVLTLSTSCSNAGSLDSALNKAEAEGKIVMLELGSEGCIPCEQMKPVMVKLSDAYKGKLEVIFVDVKKDHGAARKYKVYMIPVQVFLNKSGSEFHRHVGFYPYEEIAAMLRKKGLQK